MPIILLPDSDFDQASRMFTTDDLVLVRNSVISTLSTLALAEDPLQVVNQPALAWQGYEPQLALYGIILNAQYADRLKVATVTRFCKERLEYYMATFTAGSYSMERPAWSFDDDVILSHRAFLVRANMTYRHIFGGALDDQLPFRWV